MWATVISAFVAELAGPLFKALGVVILNWVAKHEAQDGQVTKAEATAKAAAIISAKVPDDAAANALDDGGV